MASNGSVLESNNQFELKWKMLSYNEDDCTKTLSWEVISKKDNFPQSSFIGALEVTGYTDTTKVFSYALSPAIKNGVNTGETIGSGTVKLNDRVTNITISFHLYTGASVSNPSIIYTATGSWDIKDAFIYDSGKTKSGIGSEDSSESSTLRYIGFSWEIAKQDIDNNKVHFDYKITNASSITHDFSNLSANIVFRDENGAVVGAESVTLASNLTVRNVAAGGTITSGSFTVSEYIESSGLSIYYMDLNLSATYSSTQDCVIDCMRWRYRNLPSPSNISASTSTIGTYPNLYITKSHSEALTTLTYTFGELSGTIVENYSGTLYQDWQIPEEFYYQMIDCQQKTCFINATSYLYGINLGTNTTSFVVNIDKTLAKPNLSSLTVEDSNPKTVAATGNKNIFVENASIASYSVNPITKFGATVSMLKVSNWNASSFGSSGTISPITTGVFDVLLTDSRQLTVTGGISKTMISHNRPTYIANVERATAQGTCSFNVQGNYSVVNFGVKSNTMSVYYRYKLYSGTYGDWNYVTTDSNNDGTYSAYGTVSGLDYKNTYVLQLKISDTVVDVLSEEFTIKSIPVFDWSNSDFNFNVPVTSPQLNLPIGGLYVGGTQITFDEVPEEDPTKVIESGTWTPEFMDFTPTVSTGGYMRIGNMVLINWYAKGTAAGSGYQVVITKSSLPYTPRTDITHSGGGCVTGVTIPDNQTFFGWVMYNGSIYACTTPNGSTDAATNNISYGYVKYTGASPYTAIMSGTLMYIANI